MARRVLDHVVRKASEADYYKWQQQLLEPACSIICNRLNHEEVGYTVALDENKIDRSYLYGRMLAVADQLERSTYEANEWGSRQTNAMKYMAVFASRPAATWELIQQRLLPYEQKRERYGGKEKKLLARIGSMFREEDFLSDEPLDGRFLLGYYCQQYAIEQYIASCKEKKDNKAAEGENA
jgi:CRISPR-associated protein Csd1